MNKEQIKSGIAGAVVSALVVGGLAYNTPAVAIDPIKVEETAETRATQRATAVAEISHLEVLRAKHIETIGQIDGAIAARKDLINRIDSVK